MNKITFLIINILFSLSIFAQDTWIRVNQVGYLEKDIKVAVLLCKNDVNITNFDVIDVKTDKVVYTGENITKTARFSNFNSTYRLNFSELTSPGKYLIKVNNATSPIFNIGNDTYANASEIPLQYMRQQRCGYNPFLKDSCHQFDAISVADPNNKRDGLYFNTIGGWHDASDYLQYVTTSANAIYQMLFAYSKHPESFGDKYQANGDKGANGIPDILDEAKWGLDWLVKMNPDENTYFNQLADDRDHAGMVLPTQQDVDYGWGKGKERPVYFCSSKPQGLFRHKNRSTGLASTMGKYASAYALGSKLLKPYYPEFSELLLKKTKDAYTKGKQHPGVCQTAPGNAPYFYEEDNWADDMELAAIEMFDTFNDEQYLEDAINFGRLEPITPWMGADSARHYQWYPFINLGHYHIAKQTDRKRTSKEFIRNIRSGLQRVKERAADNPFMNGIPFIWCSNNLTVAFITQCRLYHELTGDTSFLEIENAMRDWLLGCNPWGISMIVNYPTNGLYPKDPHSAFTQVHSMPITGGIVDGPIYSSIFNSLIGVYLSKEDQLSIFQSDEVVYHDDYADYSTNEPTMDGTASLCFYFGHLAAQAKKKQTSHQCAIVQGEKEDKQLALVFTGHEFADGAVTIQKTLIKNDVKAAFFLTGDFYRTFPHIAMMLQNDGHYMGPHSDKHLLYADWKNRDSTLVTRAEFEADLMNNYTAMKKVGLQIEKPKYFLPAFEWFNRDICEWTQKMNIQLINFTPGTYSNADYTTPLMSNYLSSDAILKKIIQYDKDNSLNGTILLMHIGTAPDRTDKFYDKLDMLIEILTSRGYIFTRIDKLLKK